MSAPVPQSYSRYLDLGNRAITMAGAVASAVAMGVLFVAGMLEIGAGAYRLLFSALFRQPTDLYGDHVTKLIHGVELLLLAPVPFLIFTSLNRYLRRHETDEEAHNAHSEILRVKGFITGLMFALVSTTAVGESLNSELLFPEAAASGLILIILGVYFVALERLALARR